MIGKIGIALRIRLGAMVRCQSREHVYREKQFKAAELSVNRPDRVLCLAQSKLVR